MLLLKYPYLIGSLVMLCVWLIFYVARKDLRRHMLIFSPFIAAYSVIADHWSLKDYWNPPMLFHPPYNFGGIEDLVFGFAIGGIALAGYEVVFNKKLVQIAGESTKFWSLLAFAFLVFGPEEILTRYFHLNSIFCLMITFLFIVLIILIQRRDLFVNAIFSGVIFSVIYLLTLAYFVPRVLPYLGSSAWPFYDTRLGYLVLGRVPLTEVAWAFSWGAFGGIWYKYSANLKIVNRGEWEK